MSALQKFSGETNHAHPGMGERLQLQEEQEIEKKGDIENVPLFLIDIIKGIILEIATNLI